MRELDGIGVGVGVGVRVGLGYIMSCMMMLITTHNVGNNT